MTVLVIDDSRFLQLGIQKVLEQAGYGTILVSDGQKAISLAIEKRPDLVLLDIMLPGVPGTSVLKSLRENSVTAKTPVIVLTGLSGMNEARLKSEGADAYLNKAELDLQNGGQPLLKILNKVMAARARPL